ncbi:MAG: hypothetical protein P1V36_00340 [Planctomycetota bacterium]|nr:hypothetical protein [Planctomycetota bacterium]
MIKVVPHYLYYRSPTIPKKRTPRQWLRVLLNSLDVAALLAFIALLMRLMEQV